MYIVKRDYQYCSYTAKNYSGKEVVEECTSEHVSDGRMKIRKHLRQRNGSHTKNTRKMNTTKCKKMNGLKRISIQILMLCMQLHLQNNNTSNRKGIESHWGNFLQWFPEIIF